MMSQELIVELHSDEGQHLLQQVISQTTGCYYQPKLHRVFTKQIGHSTCGLVTCCHVLSAYQHPSDDLSATPAFTEKNMFDYSETRAAIEKEKLMKDGMTIDDVYNLLVKHGCRKVQLVRAADCTVDQFRNAAIEALSSADSRRAIIVNYHMDTLGQGLPFGHHSPVCAYHATTNRLLVLDTWPDTGECWAKVDTLHSAMNTVDSETGKTRGYCVIEF